MSKNLIMGVIQNYSWIEIEPFIVSWKRNTFNSDLILFCDNISDSTKSVISTINQSDRGGGNKFN